ncbi:MAG TPA: four helix bundle protein [Planctomicrobium sp.]|nr:four helix bundle protein [Planctomicrobium sp.]
MQIRSHKDLIVWQKAMILVAECYQLTEKFPRKEQYSLSDQLQRSAVSVPANIAEGHGRKTTPAFLNHLSIANGSLAELETHIELGVLLKYVTREAAVQPLSTLQEVRRMLDGLIKSLRRRSE